MAKDAGTADLTPEQWLAIGQLFNQSKTTIQLGDVMKAVRTAYRIGLAEGQAEGLEDAQVARTRSAAIDAEIERSERRAAAADSDF